MQEKTQQGGDWQPVYAVLGEGRSAPLHYCSPSACLAVILAERKHEASNPCCPNPLSHVVNADGSPAGQHTLADRGSDEVLRGHWRVCRGKAGEEQSHIALCLEPSVYLSCWALASPWFLTILGWRWQPSFDPNSG